MKTTYFNTPKTLEELRRQYKELLKKYHPDNANGSTQATQEINAEYDALFKQLKDRHEGKSADGNTDNGRNRKEKSSFDNMKYDFSEDKALREILNKIIGFSNVTIEICGSWLWVFNSYDYRKELKEMGFKYAPKKQAWYWHSEAFRKRSHKTLSMEDVRNYYGSTEVETDGLKRLRQA